jgi:hypothetical protein
VEADVGWVEIQAGQGTARNRRGSVIMQPTVQACGRWRVGVRPLRGDRQNAPRRRFRLAGSGLTRRPLRRTNVWINLDTVQKSIICIAASQPPLGRRHSLLAGCEWSK